MRCLASKTHETSPPRRTLTCDDECLRLQRNRKLAEALNISSDHMDDHIPYSTATLDMFKDMAKWCQTQEREFRVFAADESEKRLRFKPMPSQYRAFLHCLAEDFGLDSESMDPEPHRHVVIFKTPRFVSAPMKTLAQCMKIKPKEDSSLPSTSRIQSIEPFNALILNSPRFALTVDELRAQLKADLSTAPMYTFGIEFLPSEEVVLYPKSNTLDEGLEMTLTRLKPLVTKTVTTHSLAAGVSLCRVDSSLNVVRRDHCMEAESGWSQVVKGAPLKSASSSGWTGASKSSYTVLRNASKLKEKQKAKEVEKGSELVVENWESAVDAEEGADA
jgi:transcriptional repressor NF-X1